jgi:tRNA-2-methylthio-N6-dimethylallyladenosine synthase
LLLNTCSIREKAQEKVFIELGRWTVPEAARNPELLIGVGGCVASQEGEAIAERAPVVDLVFGPQTLHRLPEMIEAARSPRQRRRPWSISAFPEIEKFDRLPEPERGWRHRPSCPSWRAVPNTAPFAWCLTPAARR